MRSFALTVSLSLLALVVPSRAQTSNWHLTATVAESCSCAIACRCNFGGEPDGGKCEGNRIISIDTGHYNDVDLSGVQLLVTFQMRTWSKIYISDKVSDAQMKAVEALLPLAFAGFHKGMLSFTKAPITMEVTDTRVRFSGPESSVDMEVMRGFNGQAVRISHLPSAVFQNYTQFRSVAHTHTGDTHRWKHSGTNGFASTWDVGSQK
jgi:hypothetical protein